MCIPNLLRGLSRGPSFLLCSLVLCACGGTEPSTPKDAGPDAPPGAGGLRLGEDQAEGLHPRGEQAEARLGPLLQHVTGAADQLDLVGDGKIDGELAELAQLRAVAQPQPPARVGGGDLGKGLQGRAPAGAVHSHTAKAYPRRRHPENGGAVHFL
jgi:hypothetical protein